MLYALYRPDGSIWQANQIYHDAKQYENLLREQQQGDFVAVQKSATLISPDAWFVDTKRCELMERPPMPIEINKTRIRTGPDDAALFTKVPANATVTVLAAGETIHSGLMDATELELHIPVPMIYTVIFSLFPYRNFQTQIEAFA